MTTTETSATTSSASLDDGTSSKKSLTIFIVFSVLFAVVMAAGIYCYTRGERPAVGRPANWLSAEEHRYRAVSDDV